jgi:hypothetical protein
MMTIQEDELLLQIVSRYPAPKWASISHDFNQEVQKLPGNSQTKRTNKQCRERYFLVDSDGRTTSTLL